MLTTYFKKLLRLPYHRLILTPHGGFNPFWPLFPGIGGFIKRSYHAGIGRWLINHSVVGIRTVSDWEKDMMIQEGLDASLITTIKNGLENEAFADIERSASQHIKTQVAAWGKYLLDIVRIYPIKNLETQIQMLVDLPVDINLVILGEVQDEIYADKLKQMARDLRVDSRLIWGGVVTGIDKYYVIKHCQIFIHLAHWESFCNVVQEAMSQGRPVVVADTYALPYLVKDEINGFCVSPNDSQKAAKYIRQLLVDNLLYRKISHQNVTQSWESTWEKTADNFTLFLRKVLEVLSRR